MTELKGVTNCEIALHIAMSTSSGNGPKFLGRPEIVVKMIGVVFNESDVDFISGSPEMHHFRSGAPSLAQTVNLLTSYTYTFVPTRRSVKSQDPSSACEVTRSPQYVAGCL
jgi:hypothetical protein